MLAVVAGLAFAALAQFAAPPAKPPLYDGLSVPDPYRYLVPASGQRGDPGSATASAAVKDGRSPAFSVATGEQPPQAQLLAAPGALVLPAGTTDVRIAITPVVTPAQAPRDGQIAGNVYRVQVTNQAGVALTAPASARVSVALRAPGGYLSLASVERLSPAGWERLPSATEVESLVLAVATSFGDFALVVPPSAGAGDAPSSGLPTTLVMAVLAAIVLVAALLGLAREGAQR